MSNDSQPDIPSVHTYHSAVKVSSENSDTNVEVLKMNDTSFKVLCPQDSLQLESELFDEFGETSDDIDTSNHLQSENFANHSTDHIRLHPAISIEITAPDDTPSNYDSYDSDNDHLKTEYNKEPRIRSVSESGTLSNVKDFHDLPGTHSKQVFLDVHTPLGGKSVSSEDVSTTRRRKRDKISHFLKKIKKKTQAEVGKNEKMNSSYSSFCELDYSDRCDSDPTMSKNKRNTSNQSQPPAVNIKLLSNYGSKTTSHSGRSSPLIKEENVQSKGFMLLDLPGESSDFCDATDPPHLLQQNLMLSKSDSRLNDDRSKDKKRLRDNKLFSKFKKIGNKEPKNNPPKLERIRSQSVTLYPDPYTEEASLCSPSNSFQDLQLPPSPDSSRRRSLSKSSVPSSRGSSPLFWKNKGVDSIDTSSLPLGDTAVQDYYKKDEDTVSNHSTESSATRLWSNFEALWKPKR